MNGPASRLSVLGGSRLDSSAAITSSAMVASRAASVCRRAVSRARKATAIDAYRLAARIAVIASAEATHPQLVGGTTWSPSAGFQDPGTYIPALPLPREPVEDGDPVFAVDDAKTLAGLRHQLGAVIASLVPDRDLQGDLHLAASEIAASRKPAAHPSVRSCSEATA